MSTKKHNCETDDRKLPIDRPCSACSDGDHKMEYHDHCPPFRGEQPAQGEPRPGRLAWSADDGALAVEFTDAAGSKYTGVRQPEVTEVRCGRCNTVMPGGIDTGHVCRPEAGENPPQFDIPHFNEPWNEPASPPATAAQNFPEGMLRQTAPSLEGQETSASLISSVPTGTAREFLDNYQDAWVLSISENGKSAIAAFAEAFAADQMYQASEEYEKLGKKLRERAERAEQEKVKMEELYVKQEKRISNWLCIFERIGVKVNANDLINERAERAEGERDALKEIIQHNKKTWKALTEARERAEDALHRHIKLADMLRIAATEEPESPIIKFAPVLLGILEPVTTSDIKRGQEIAAALKSASGTERKA